MAKECQISPKTCEAGCQTTLTMNDVKMNEQYLRNDTTELSDLKPKMLETRIDQDEFCDNDEKTRFYTGLPYYFTFLQVFNFVCPYVKSTRRNVLTPFQELLLNAYEKEAECSLTGSFLSI